MSEVLVVGGGVAGCAAAAAAARAGAAVVLAEAGRHLGGAAARGEHRALCGLAPLDAPAPALLEPELTAAWVERLATGAPERVGRVWLWPTDSAALARGLADGLRAAGVEVRLGARLEALERDGDALRAAVLGGARLAVRAVVDASGAGACARLLGLPVAAAAQWGAHRSVLHLALAAGPAARVRALAAAQAVAGDSAALALSPLGGDRWQLSQDLPPGARAPEAAARAQRIARALGAELVACARSVAERDEGRPAARVTLAELFACAERGLCWAAWPREEHGPDGVAWTWPPRDRHGVPERAARAAEVANLWYAGKALAVDVGAAAALRVTGTCLALGGAVGARAAAGA